MPVEPGTAAADAYAYWGVIHAAAAQHATTAQIWAAIRAAAAEQGPGVKLPPFAGVNVLRGYAGAMTRAAEALGRALDSAAITSEHIAEAPWARPPAAQAVVPEYHALVGFSYTDEFGAPQQDNMTVIFSMSLPATAGDLRAAIEQDVSEALLTGGKGTGTPKGELDTIDSILLVAV